MPEFLKIRVKSITFDFNTKSPIIFLETFDGSMNLSMVIGDEEAYSITLSLAKKEPPRPLTHNLLLNILDEFRIELVKVIIYKLQNNTFFASLILKKGDDIYNFDARPSDSIALALRKEADIYVEKSLLTNVFGKIDKNEILDLEYFKTKKFLDSIIPENFGKLNI